MFKQIEETVKSPKFQRDAIRATGSVLALVAGMAASGMVRKAIGTGVEKLIEKYLPEVVEVVTEAVQS